MAIKTTLNAKDLDALGALRLAELLIKISTGSAAHKRRLSTELGSLGRKMIPAPFRGSIDGLHFQVD